MQRAPHLPADILKENEELRARLEQAESLLRAIRSGDVDALVIQNAAGPQVSLQGQDAEANQLREERLFAESRDISGRKQAEDELRRSDQLHRIAFDLAPIGMVYVSLDARFLNVNARMCEITGYTVDELLRMTVGELTHPDDLAQDGERLQAFWSGVTPVYENEKRYVRKDGSSRWVGVTARMVTDDAGQPLHTVGAIRDIQQRKMADAALHSSEIRYRRLFEAAHDGVLIVDAATRKIVDANPFMTTLLGYPHGQLIGMELYQIGFLADAQESQDMFQTLTTTRQVRYENLPLQTQQGGLRQVEVVANLYDEDSHSVVQCNVRDITERRRAETALEERQNFLRRIFEVLPGVLYIFDLDENRCVFINNTAALTYSPEEISGMGADLVRNLMHPDDQQRFQEHIARIRTLNPGETAAFEYRMRDRADEWRWYMSNDAVFLRDENGVARQFIGIAPEITDRKRQEEHIRLLMGEVNHRSKNMLGLVQAIARQTVATRPEDFLERFDQRVQALAASQDLLVKSEWKAVSLDDLIRSQLAHFGDVRDTRVALDGPPVEITASASQSIGMALHELATNAGKYGALSNGSGRVLIRWSLRSDPAGKARFTLSWIESGGPAVAKPTRQGFGSTVIGRMIKMSFGCDVEIDFAPTGLVWRIDCLAADMIKGSASPMPQPNGAAANEESTQASSRRRVLVVEDEPLIAMDVAHTLSEAGYAVIGPANSVAQALMQIAQFGCDAAVLDINLGAETAEPVARELIRRGTPFITTSGYSREQQPEIMRTAPLLGKPLQPELLIAEIARCLDR